MRSIAVICSVYVICLCAAAQSDTRTWTAKSGQSMRASYSSNRSDLVILEDVSGKELTIPFNRLSAGDQLYVLKQSDQDKSEQQLPIYDGRYFQNEEQRKADYKNFIKQMKRTGLTGTWLWAPTIDELHKRGYAVRDYPAPEDISDNSFARKLDRISQDIGRSEQRRKQMERTGELTEEQSQSLWQQNTLNLISIIELRKGTSASQQEELVTNGGFTSGERETIDLQIGGQIVPSKAKGHMISEAAQNAMDRGHIVGEDGLPVRGSLGDGTDGHILDLDGNPVDGSLGL